jgi:hypothetical protein
MGFRWRLVALVLGGSACGISFGPAAPPPASKAAEARGAVDEEHAEERREDAAHLKAGETTGRQSMPAVGVSVVVGGTPFDAGSLPKPPVTIVKPAE